ncbi:DNA adenine methylase [Qipengyuania vesicularis]|uniref:DNA adenine methylase n=1 Tax=Qipengyuania vesicularis TaxID=2867232 RepID=UPI001C875D52|nr:DNA adenine methylase [Qipengyuania vesicularis]MBX7526996.1 DNA adenine methylase [Qipengyuania vesicularis]
MYLPKLESLHDFESEAPELGWYNLSPQSSKFPSTRFMGSKEQLLEPIWRAVGQFSPQKVLDICSGSGVVGYMLKSQGCEVVSNDQMTMATTIANALIANSSTQLSKSEIESLSSGETADGMIWSIYQDLYYDEADVRFLDFARLAINRLSGHKRSLARAALIRACLKRRPRGIFTYTGRRYDDGRKDLQVSLRDHFRLACEKLSEAVFDNGRESQVTKIDLSEQLPAVDVDVVYMDPPYYSPLSDNHYVRRYHFTEAIARDWDGIEIQERTKTKKFKNYANPFAKELSCAQTIERVLDGYRKVPVILSYSSNSLPNASAIKRIVERHGRHCTIREVDHRYSFANQANAKQPVRNKVKELLFIAE